MSLREQILEVVRQRQRHIPRHLGLLPKTVAAWLDTPLCEQRIRAEMAHMAADGLLWRIGGTGARRGYRVMQRPTAPRPSLQIVVEVQLSVA